LCLLRDARGREDKITALAGCKEGATQSEILKGWQQIAAFQGEPVSVVKTMGHSGNASPARGPIRFDFSLGTQRLAWKGIRQSSSCRHGNHGSHSRAEAWIVFCFEKKDVPHCSDHYSKWMKGKQDRLDSLVTGTWKK
jgi:hypothetical protein